MIEGGKSLIRWTVADGRAVLLLVLLPLVLRLPGLLPGRLISSSEMLFNLYPWKTLRAVPAPHNPTLSDMTFQTHPLLAWSAREVKRGHFPLWNPHTYCGAPMLGQMQTGLFSPFTALAYVFPFDTAVGLASILKHALAGVSMFLFLRVISCSTSAALFGGVTFGFCGFVTVWLAWALGATAVWMPVLFLTTELLLRTRTLRSAGLLAITVGVQFTGGHPETSFHNADGSLSLRRVAGGL